MLDINDLEKIPKNIIDKRKNITQKDQNRSKILEGSRNDHLFKHSSKLKEKNLSFDQVFALSQLENKNCYPPLENNELFNIVKSAMSSCLPEKEIEILTIEQLYDDKNFTTPEPIVEGLINKGEFHLCSATAKTGKTLLALNLAFSIATGKLFLDKFKTIKNIVLVIQTEISNNHLRFRIKKIFGNDISSIKEIVLFANERIKVDTITGLKSLERLIEKEKPGLVILDPFYTLHNRNEDSSSEMAPVLSNIRELVLKTEISLLMIHHQGKKKESGSQTGHKHRGSSAFADVPDGSWSLQKSGNSDFLSIEFEMRNIEAPGPFQLHMDKESLKFSITKTIENTTERIRTNEVTEYIKENPGLFATELKEKLSSLYGVSGRTVSNKISECVNNNYIYRKRDGKHIRYYLCKTQEPETCTKSINCLHISSEI